MKHILIPLLVIGLVNSIFSPVPLLLWSKSSIESQHTVTQTLNAQHLQDLFSSLLSHSTLGTDHPLHAFVKSTNPEAVILFVTPDLHTDDFIRQSGAYSAQSSGGAFAPLKTAVENANGAIIAPYVDSSAVSSLIASFKPASGASILVVEDAKTPQFTAIKADRISRSQLVRRLKDSSDAMHSNGVTDLILVSLEATEDQPQHISEISAAVADREYVAAFTSVAAAHPLQQQLQKRQAATPVVEGSRTPSSLLEAGLTLVFLLLIFSFGACCMCQIQTPARFDTGKNIVVAE